MDRFTDMVDYFYFTENMINQQNEMERYINECIILSNSNRKKVFQEMTVFNEVVFGDKAKSLFSRLKTFFAKLFGKITESLSKIFAGNKEYLDKYKDIILGKTVKISGKMKKFIGSSGGIERTRSLFKNAAKITVPIQAAKYDEFIDQAKKDSKKTEGDDRNDAEKEFKNEQYTAVLSALNIPSSEVDPKTSDDISADLKSYYCGGDEIVEYTNTDFSTDVMKEIYKFLYSSDELTSGLAKFRDTYQSCMAKSEQAFDQAFEKAKKLKSKSLDTNATKETKDNAAGELKKMADDAKTAADTEEQKRNSEKQKEQSTSKPQNHTTPNRNSTQSGPKPPPEMPSISTPTTSNREAYVYSTVYQTYLNEFEVTGSSSPESSKSTDNVSADTNKINTQAASTTASNTSKAATSKTKTIKANTADYNDTAKNAAVQGVANAESDTDLEAFQTLSMSYIKAFSEARTMVFSAACTAINMAQKELFQFVSAHVRSYIGSENNTDDDTNVSKL